MSLKTSASDKLVMTFYNMGPYEIIIIQSVYGDLIHLRIEEYDE